MNKGFICFLIVIYSYCPALLNAEIYKWTDEDGNTYFSDKKSAVQQARPVQLKSNLNSYRSDSVPKHENNSPSTITQKTESSNIQLPALPPKRVIMYSTDWCGYCKKAKAYFKQKGISFSERDIEKSNEANKEYKSYGGGGVPLILVGSKKGTQKLSGFSIARFNSVYY